MKPIILTGEIMMDGKPISPPIPIALQVLSVRKDGIKEWSAYATFTPAGPIQMSREVGLRLAESPDEPPARMLFLRCETIENERKDIVTNWDFCGIDHPPAPVLARLPA